MIAFRIASQSVSTMLAGNKQNNDAYSEQDYHVMVQLDDGRWSELHGATGIIETWPQGMTPETIPWTYNGKDYYDSRIIYIAFNKF